MSDDTRAIDLRPVAVPGWRAIFLDQPTGHHVEPLAGWLIREEVSLDADLGLSESMPPPGYRERSIVAAVAGEGGGVEPVASRASFWCVLGPGQPDPTAEQESDERQRRQQAYEHTQKTREHDRAALLGPTTRTSPERP